jgi:acetolactate synthase-1/2/3 large subunit
MTIAEYIADKLSESGVRYVFGIPGGPSIPYMEAFRNADIEFILVSHESSAAVMADVSARLTGVPGVCHATFGPGATNITTGAGLALLDRNPVIVFTSEMPDSMRERVVQMNIDHQKLFMPVTKQTFRINTGNVDVVMEQALRIVNEEYPGPVHIGLPSDIAERDIPLLREEREPASEKEYKNNTPAIISMLEKAKRPILAIGLTSARFGLRRKINDFLASFPMPVVLTPMAKGLVREDHPCYAGVLFHALSDYLEDIIRTTDCVIGLGYDPVEYNYESWLPDVSLIHFDTRPPDLLPGRQSIYYAGHPAGWFQVLNNINSSGLIFESAIVKGIRNEMEAVFNGFLSHFGPVTALRALREELPDDAIVSFDVGSHLHLAGQYWKTPAQERMIITNGWSSMGFGIPAAVAAKLNRPEKRVACVTGDGGFLMSAGELMTARRYNINIMVVVLSDGELNLIKLKQSWKDLPAYATTINTGDMFSADRFLGIRVLKAESEDEMRKAVKASLSADEPCIINAVIDPEDYRWMVVKQK